MSTSYIINIPSKAWNIVFSLTCLIGLCIISGCEEKVEPTNTPPSVSTGAVSDITAYTAAIAGEITNEGSSTVSTRGFCLGISAGPTLDDTCIPGGSGIGDFTVNVGELDPDTKYFVRAYGVNATDTTYGNEVEFMTLEEEVVCENSPGVVYDYDCNPYDVIQIGDQFWLKQNLKTSHYRNGVAIPTGLNDVEWTDTDEGAYAMYDDLEKNDDIYGKLYNWFTVNNIHGLCPYGWHVPTLTEIITLEIFLGGADLAGGKMKSVSSLWNFPNEGADDVSDFSALPGGHRFYSTGTYGNQGINGVFWTSSSSANGGGSLAFYYVLNYSISRLERPYLPKNGGYSCRCIKD